MPSVGFEDLVDRVKPTVVGVRARVEQDAEDEGSFGRGSLERFFGSPKDDSDAPHPRFATSQGSGFFISSDGYIVTTSHLVEHGDRIEVTTDDGGIHSAVLVGADPKTDLALLKVEGGEFPAVRMADRPPRIGQWVIAVGNPFGLGGTVTAGIVSAGTRDIKVGSYNDFVQIDAPVNQGNSGGPTFDVKGNVVGVNSAIFSPTGGSVGIGFAIPAETVKTIVAKLKDKGVVTRGWIGVEIQPVTPDVAEGLGLDKQMAGVVVAELQPGSPAVTAGIMAGDVIRTLGGEPVNDDREVVRRVGDMTPGQSVELSVLRKREEKTVTVTIGELPISRSKGPANTERQEGSATGSNGAANLGLKLTPAENLGLDRQGVIVTEIDPGGVAAESGIAIGDIILDVSGDVMKSPGDVQKALADARNQGKHVALARVRSNETTRYIAIPVG
jgi:serine protease Do